MNYTKLKYLTVIFSVLFVVALPGSGSAAKTYEWANISQSLALDE